MLCPSVVGDIDDVPRLANGEYNRGRGVVTAAERRLTPLTEVLIRSRSTGRAPTGRRVGFVGHSIDRVVGGKVVESWVEVDMLGVMWQLGALPEPGQTEEASSG
jgi:SnoaL-like polyketide cyclase